MAAAAHPLQQEAAPGGGGGGGDQLSAAPGSPASRPRRRRAAPESPEPLADDEGRPARPPPRSRRRPRPEEEEAGGGEGQEGEGAAGGAGRRGPLVVDDLPRTIKEIMRDSRTGLPSARIVVQPARKRQRRAKREGGDDESPASSPAAPSPTAESGDDAGASSSQAAAGPAPRAGPAVARMKMVNGQLVLDQDSLVVATGRKEPLRYNNVYENNPRTTSSSYSRRTKVDKWTNEDTRLFYHGLRQFGTDFSMLVHLFPNRDRRQLKNKFKLEERDNLTKIEMALRERIPIDMKVFEECLAVSKKKRDEKKRLEEER